MTLNLTPLYGKPLTDDGIAEPNEKEVLIPKKNNDGTTAGHFMFEPTPEEYRST